MPRDYHDPLLPDEDEDATPSLPPDMRRRYDNLFDDDEEEVEELSSVEYLEEPEPPPDTESPPGPVKRTPTTDQAKEDAERQSIAEQLKERFGVRQVRPGDHDVIRSPLVLGLGGGAALLVLVALTLWFITSRNKSEHQYQAAEQALNEGRFNQSVEMFQKFLEENPTDQRGPDARIGIGRAGVLRHLSGATPDWNQAVRALEDFVRQYRDLPPFDGQLPDVRRWAEEIARGAALDAVRLSRRDLIHLSERSLKFLKRHSPVDQQPDALEQELANIWLKATDVADRQEEFVRSVNSIQAALAAEPPDTRRAFAERHRLLLQFPALSGDRTLTGLLSETLAKERASVRSDPTDAQPQTNDPLAELPPLVGLTEHTRTRAGEQSEGGTVFTVGKGVCFGVDTVTGEPLWRRPLGRGTSFFPMPVQTATPGLLAFDVMNRELLLLERRNGLLQWRLPIGERVVEQPLIESGHIYLPTASGRLYKLDLESGRVLGRLQFPQPLIGPPVPSRDGNDFVVVGRQEVAYTVSLREFTAVAVAFIGHGAASIDAPPIPAVDAPTMALGSLLLLAENAADSCRLRLLDMSDPRSGLPQRGEVRVPGQVRSAPLLRGNRLFVPSGEKLMTVYSVSDEPDQLPLTRLAQQEISGSQGGLVYLTSASSDQVWLASAGLHQLSLTTGTLSVLNSVAADGMAAQPLQRAGDIVFLGRHRPYSNSVLFSQYHMDTLASNWGLTVGSGILAATGSDETLACFNEDGRLFRLVESELTADRNVFSTNPTLRLNLPDGLNVPLLAVAVDEEHIAVTAGGAKPTCWIMTVGGQVTQSVPLDAPPQAAPAPLADGVLVPLPDNRLQFIALRRGSSPVDDYRPQIDAANEPQDRAPSARWVHVTGIDAEHVLALDTAGNLVQVQYRLQPSRHLYGVRSVQLASPVVMPFVVHDGLAVFADVARRLSVFDATTLQPVATLPLPGMVTNRLWATEGQVFVETNRGDLHCFALRPEPRLVWSLPAEPRSGETAVAGGPLRDGGRLLIARRNGHVDIVDAQTGERLAGIDVRQPLDSGPRRVADRVFVTSLDGSLLRIDPLLPQP